MTKKYRWDAILDKKIWLPYGVVPGLYHTDTFGSGPYDTREDAKKESPKVGSFRVSERTPYIRAKVIKVKIKSFEQKFRFL